MGTQVVSPKNLDIALKKLLSDFDKETERDAALVLRETMKNMFGSIIEMTPVGDFDPDHEGVTKANWILSKGQPSRAQLFKKQPRRTRSSLRFGSLKSVMGNTWYLTNNMPWINKLEFGGYPKSVKVGTWNKRTKQFQIRSSGGFSKQAAKGMARINTRKLKHFLTIAANKVL